MDRTKTYICTQTLPCLKILPTRHVDRYLRPLLRNKIYIFAQNRDNHVCKNTHSQARNMLMDICTQCHTHHMLFPERLWHLLPSFENPYNLRVKEDTSQQYHRFELYFFKMRNLPPQRIFLQKEYFPGLFVLPTVQCLNSHQQEGVWDRKVARDNDMQQLCT